MDSSACKIDTKDLLEAEEAYNDTGVRQVRSIALGRFLYLDARDVVWMVNGDTRTINALRLCNFWAQVALFVALSSMSSCELADLIFGH